MNGTEDIQTGVCIWDLNISCWNKNETFFPLFWKSWILKFSNKSLFHLVVTISYRTNNWIQFRLNSIWTFQIVRTGCQTYSVFSQNPSPTHVPHHEQTWNFRNRNGTHFHLPRRRFRSRSHNKSISIKRNPYTSPASKRARPAPFI